VKQIANMVNYIGWLAANGTEKTADDKVGGYGYLTVGELSNGGSGSSDNSKDYLKKFIWNVCNQTSVIEPQTLQDCINIILAQTDDSKIPRVTDPSNLANKVTWIDLLDNNLCFKC
jgi:hypothetical protein